MPVHHCIPSPRLSTAGALSETDLRTHTGAGKYERKMGAPPASQEPPARTGSPEHHEEAQNITIQDAQHLLDIVQKGDWPGPDTALPPPAADFEQDEEEEEAEQDEASYWDAPSMAPLNAASAVRTVLSRSYHVLQPPLTRTQAAVARLRAYTPPPFPLWDRLPVSRRAAVLLLLYADRRGDLRVVITMRAASLRSFSGTSTHPSHE